MIIQRDLKLLCSALFVQYGLRVVIIQRDLKLYFAIILLYIRLRVVIIQRDLKPKPVETIMIIV